MTKSQVTRSLSLHLPRPSSNETTTTESYPISLTLNPEPVFQLSSSEKRLMVVECRACRKEFDTTFTAEDFQRLSRDQKETGTLHLCPFCGDLSLYMLRDYYENKSE